MDAIRVKHMNKTAVLLVTAATILSACGTREPDRVQGGAAAGAATGATVVVAANPGCVMQLAAHLPPGVSVVHPVELLVPDPTGAK